MKIKLLAGVVATCFAAPAMAQSSMVMYGIADAGLMWQKGGTTKVVSGIADGSRLGFKGTEDIGGGYKAIFNLEARVELDTGTQKPTLINDNQGFYLTRGMTAGFSPIVGAPTAAALVQGLRTGFQVPGSAAVNPEGALFDRTAMVGLITPVGAVLLGRMYTPGYEVFAASDVFESGTAGTWGGITGGTAGFTALGADIRSSKSIQYRIATPSGFGGSLMYGAKGSGYLNRYNKFLGASATYKANGWDIGIGHNRGYDQGDAVSLVTTTVGGSYTMGKYKFFAGYHDQRNDHSALLREYIAGYDGLVAPRVGAANALLRPIFVSNITENTREDANSVQVGLHVRIGTGRLMASFAHQNDRTPSNSDANLFALGYDYNLSKRTDVYTVVAQINNKNEAQYSPGTAGSPGGFTKNIGDNGRALQVGMRHRF